MNDQSIPSSGGKTCCPGPYDLHVHLGGGVPAPILWEIIMDEGYNFDGGFKEFQNKLTVTDVKNLDEYLDTYFHLTEDIQSSPRAIEASCYHIVAKAYRRSGVKGIEVRFNPYKRLRGNLINADAIIHAALIGLERASLHYGVKTGLIFSMGRDISTEANKQICKWATEWMGANRNVKIGAYGVVGLDMAGPERYVLEMQDTWLHEVANIYETAKSFGLKSTYHIGETNKSGPKSMMKVITVIQPDRIGHGLQCVHSTKVLDMLSESNIHLELCPVSSITTQSASQQDMCDIVRILSSWGIRFNLNTDNPYLIHTNIAKEYETVGILGFPNVFQDGAWQYVQHCLDDAETSTFLQ